MASGPPISSRLPSLPAGVKVLALLECSDADEEDLGILLLLVERQDTAERAVVVAAENEQGAVELVIPMYRTTMFQPVRRALDPRRHSTTDELVDVLGSSVAAMEFELPDQPMSPMSLTSAGDHSMRTIAMQFVGHIVQSGGIRTYKSLSFECEDADASAIAEFQRLCAESLQLAVENNFVEDGPSHTWVSQWTFVSNVPFKGTAFHRRDVTSEMSEDSAVSDHDIRSFQRLVHADEMALRTWKERWINEQLIKRESEYTDHEKLRVFIGTYNVNNKRPNLETDPEGLVPWLRADPENPPDIYVLGFQEIDLSAEAFVRTDIQRETDWTAAIFNAFHEGHDYVKAKSRQLIGMLLMVFVRRHLMPIPSIHSDVQGTGIMGVMGNKGAVAVSMTLQNTSLCFINSHLAAHDDAVMRRNQDYHEIVRRVSFDSGTRTVFDHDYIFWLGDLNYRLDAPSDTVKALATQGKITELLRFDQLSQQKMLRAAFKDFVEPPITFLPTYKYDPGTDSFDSSEKMRTPAYTDRIQFMVRGPPATRSVSIREYKSSPAVRLSDHKPVKAQFFIDVLVIDPPRQQKVYRSIVRQLDSIENKSKPDVIISEQQFDFGQVRFLQTKTLSFIIENVGQTPARYSLKPKADGENVTPPWLWVDLGPSIVMPGDKSEVRLKVLLDADVAAELNAGTMVMEDVLILHIENGKDYFVSVTGQFLSTCLARPLVDLVFMLRPARTYELSRIPHDQGRLHIPKELWLLVEAMLERDVSTPDLVMQPGSREQVQEIFECLDVGRPFPGSITIYSLMEAIVKFLDNLPEPLIPFGLYDRVLSSSHSPLLCRQIVSELSVVHQCVFWYIVKFLQQVSRQHSERQGLLNAICFVFARVMVKDFAARDRADSTSDNCEGPVKFFRHFLLAGDQIAT